MSTLLDPNHSASGAAAAPPSSRPARDPWPDNVKMLLVTLVVVGHSWPLLPDTDLNRRLYDAVYLWHMPAFIVLTGYLSRRFVWDRRNLRRVVTTLVLPYLVFEGLFALYRVRVGGERLDGLWLDPHWPLWYLVAVAVWRLVTPLLRDAPQPLALAVVASLVSGLVSVDVLDLNRILGFLPFFVLGLLLEPRHLDLVRSRGARLAGLPVLALVAWLTGPFDRHLSTEWLYYRASYAEMDAGVVEGMLLRTGLLALAVAASVAVLAWVPRRQGWFTRMGAASVVVYLFHGFAVKGAEYAGLPAWTESHPWLSLPLVSAAAVLVSLVLAWRPVSRRLETVVSPDP